MKLATARINNNISVCCVIGDFLYPLNSVMGMDMQQLIENWSTLESAVRNEVSAIAETAPITECIGDCSKCSQDHSTNESSASASGQLVEISDSDPQKTSGIPLSEAQLMAPIPYPARNIVCLGKNYLAHVKEIKGITGGPKDTAPEHAIYFTKAAYPCNHHKGVILRHPEVTERIDYESELTVVIGKQGTYIPKEEALDYVFGYTIGNDISARDVQNRHVNWFMGKSLNTHCPVGPVIVTADDIPDPQTLKVQSFVNGELRQDGHTADMIRTVADIIHELSQGYELFPGDMIMTGTPKGVGMGFDPPRYLNPGDEIICRIDKIGDLVNYIEK